MRARHQRAPQIKAATGEEVALAFDQFMRAFEAFKEVNDERLEAIEKRVGADVVTLDKLERINRAVDEQKRLFDELQLKARRPGRGLALDGVTDDRHRSAFEVYVRKGDIAALAGLEAKALSAGSGQDGGYLVPAETETTVMSALKAISPIRAIATVRQVSGTVYKKPFSTTGFGTGWVGETAARPETTTSTLAELSFPAMELYAMPAASSALLDDTAVDIDAWIADEVRNSLTD